MGMYWHMTVLVGILKAINTVMNTPLYLTG